jgi:hypothetical protein
MLDYALVLQSLAAENRDLRTANLQLQKEVVLMMHALKISNHVLKHDSNHVMMIMMMCWYSTACLQHHIHSWLSTLLYLISSS